ncbi:hypothetical protein V6N11_075291 [Hibiscus sabdariffa]|uniref:Uncharacterized protein n=1 Tax=Hibiscus sabdariffa TaxID=183260 RepID=A0ABR2R6J2_9ROSI
MAKEGKLVKKTRGPIPTTKPQADKGTQNPYYDAIDKRFSRAECLAMAERLKENPRHWHPHKRRRRRRNLVAKNPGFYREKFEKCYSI